MRSALTILMVVIGAALIVSLNGMSAGMNVFIDQQFNRLAPNLLIITPAPMIQTGGAVNNPVELNAQTVRNLESITGVEEVIPMIQRGVKLHVGGSTLTVGVLGLDQIKGRQYITPTLEYAEGTQVLPHDSLGAAVGHKVNYPPGRTTPLIRLGQAISIEYTSIQVVGGEQKQVTQKRSFIVRGIIEDMGSSGAGVNLNNAVLISLPAANALFKSGGKYDMIMVATKDPDLNDGVEAAIHERYGEDLGVTSPKALIETIQGFISGFSVFFLSIAAVSLVVAAVGVVTTLFTSVMERTREIGVLKALGFKNRSIMMLFLSEATMIGILGASVGVTLGVIVGKFLLGGLISAGFGGEGGFSLTPVFLPTDLIFIWIFSVVISSIAGFYPAWRASRLDPVVSLRKE